MMVMEVVVQVNPSMEESEEAKTWRMYIILVQEPDGGGMYARQEVLSDTSHG